MDFKDKYFKYKEKYLKLKNQIGGYRIIKNRDNESQEIIIKDKSTSTQMELIFNKIANERLQNPYEISAFLFNFTDDSKIKELSNNDFRIITIILKEIEGSITEEELDFLNELRGIKKVAEAEAEAEIINETPFLEYKYINPIPDSIIVKKIDTLFSLLFSFDDQSFSNSNGVASYFINIHDLIQERLKFLKLTGIPNPISVFNTEKQQLNDNYNKLGIIYPLFETLFIRSLEIDNSLCNGHKNTGIITLEDHQYFYKELDSLEIKSIFPNPDSLLRNYQFIMNCNYFNIDKDYKYNDINGDNIYKLHFVIVPLKVIFSIKNDSIVIGYLMEIVDGHTIRKIKKNYSKYWKLNKELIKTALHSLVEVLTKKRFLIVDFNDDNIMWNKETNTLTYIDISESSFLRPHEVHMNSTVNYAIDKL